MKWIFPFSGLNKGSPLRLRWRAKESRLPERAPEAADISASEKTDLVSDGTIHTTKLRSTAYLEILVFGGLIPFALVWFSQAQTLPFMLSAIILSPLLLGLHYGFLAGTCGAALTTASLAWLSYLKPDLLGEFPKAQVIDLLLIGMCSGEAHDRWVARVQRLSYLCHYHQTRLQQFTGAYQLLQVSHSQLERRLTGDGNSLRTALQRLKLREPVFDASLKEPLGGIGNLLLEILVEAGHLHTAAVYALNERGVLSFPAVAIVGKVADLSLFNPLLRETLRTGMVTSVQAGNDAIHEHVIAVIPLIDASGHIHGVASINDMPFLRVHQDTFELLGLLGRHIGDILARRTQTLGEAQGPCGLRESLERNLADAKRHALPAALLACKIVDAARRDALVSDCCHSSRGLDQSWVSLNRKGLPVVLTLFPLTDEAGVKSYMARLESEEAGRGTVTHGIVTYLWMLDKNRTADEILAEIGVVCDIEALVAFGATLATHDDSASEVVL
ncbi:MAG: PelD GGDEF domain-containing protein [Polaromonas sp.]